MDNCLVVDIFFVDDVIHGVDGIEASLGRMPRRPRLFPAVSSRGVGYLFNAGPSWWAVPGFKVLGLAQLRKGHAVASGRTVPGRTEVNLGSD